MALQPGSVEQFFATIHNAVALHDVLTLTSRLAGGTEVAAIPPLERVRWWEYTDDPKVLFCSICQRRVTNYFLAIDHHVRTHHTAGQI
jgi:hypothetical protein